MRLSIEEVDSRRLRDGEVSRDPGLLREWGESDLGDDEAWASRLDADAAGDLDREDGCVYGSDLLRTRDSMKSLAVDYLLWH